MESFPNGLSFVDINGHLYPFIVDLPIENGDFPIFSIVMLVS